MKLISIAMATYNGEKYLNEQIISILNQSYTNFELIISDDCSIDNTFNLLENFAKLDKRISLFRNNKNLGFKKNFEQLIKYCSGEYIAFADQDDIWDVDHLKKLFQIIGENDIACSNSLLIDSKGKSLGITMKDVLNIDIIPNKQIDITLRLIYANFVQGTASLFRAELLKKYLPIPENVPYHDLWFAVIGSFNNGVVYSTETTLKYRQHGKNITVNKKFSYLKEFYYITTGKIWEFYYSRFNLILALESVTSGYDFTDSKQFYFNMANRINIDQSLDYFNKNYESLFLSKNYFKLRKFLYFNLYYRL